MTTNVDGILVGVNEKFASIANFFVAMQDSYAGIYMLIHGFAYVGALVLTVTGIRRLSVIAGSGGRAQWTYGQVIAGLFVAASLAYAPTFLKVLSCTTGMSPAAGFGVSGAMDYVRTTGLSVKGRYIAAIVDFIKIVGLIAFIKGVLQLRALVQGTAEQGVTWGSIKWTLIGGMLCWNLVEVATILGNTIGIKVTIFNEISQQAASGSGCG